MDTRFPPQPNKTLVPLYTNSYVIRSSLLPRFGQSFKEWMCTHYQVASNQVLLANSGSQALLVFLQWLKQKHSTLHVAMPAFCCSEVLHAVLSSGAIPVFLDYHLSESGIRFAKKMNCKAVIWPQFFGDSVQPHVKLVKDLGMIFINDEAQAFPSKQRCDAQVTLFSCGVSKKIASVGGGGICIHDKKLAIEFDPEVAVKGAMYPVIKSVVKRRVVEFNRSLAGIFNLTPSLEADLKTLLEKNWSHKGQLEFSPMSQYQQKMALSMLERYQDGEVEFKNRVKVLKEIISTKFGRDALALVGDIDAPSIFAIRVPNRYAVSALLSQKGIQTTWYYYPLNRLSRFQHLPSENTPASDLLAQEILILPFQWKHSSKKFKRLCEAVSNENFSYI